MRAPTYNQPMDRIRRIQIKGLRSLEDVTLDLDGLTVLIGENGSGKSTIIEACRLLKQIGTLNNDFTSDTLIAQHRIRQTGGGFEDLQLSVEIGPSLLSAGTAGHSKLIRYELTVRWAEQQRLEELVATRSDDQYQWTDVLVRNRAPFNNRTIETAVGEGEITFLEADGKYRRIKDYNFTRLSVHVFGGMPAPEAVLRLRTALESIVVHQPFETRPFWYDNALQRVVGTRYSAKLGAASALSVGATNLITCLHVLKNSGREIWDATCETLTLGLGTDFREVNITSDGGELHTAQFVFGRLGTPVPLAELSEGQIAFVAFVALSQLAKNASLVAFDEPETHLNPGILGRVVDLFDELSETTPVLLSTHSDRLLDMLPDPAKSVVLTELDENRRTVLKRPTITGDELAKWLERYNGYGGIRAEGYEHLLYSKPDEEKATP